VAIGQSQATDYRIKLRQGNYCQGLLVNPAYFVYRITNFRLLVCWISGEFVTSVAQLFGSNVMCVLWCRYFMQELAKRLGMTFHEVSAKSGEGINELFTDVARQFITKNFQNAPKAKATVPVDHPPRARRSAMCAIL
jgi:hypothetical protein